MRVLAASPDYVVGSVHAVTETGSSGSQLGPIVSGAERVIFVVGGKRSFRTSKQASGGFMSTHSRLRTVAHEMPTALLTESTTS
jgi:hypothetical protein